MTKKTTVISDELLQQQFDFCDKIAAYWQAREYAPKAYVETYGCQQNEADSEKIRGVLVQSGYAITGEAEGADVVVMNTCAIREHAEQRVSAILARWCTPNAAIRSRRFSFAAVWPVRRSYPSGSKKATIM